MFSELRGSLRIGRLQKFTTALSTLPMEQLISLPPNWALSAFRILLCGVGNRAPFCCDTSSAPRLVWDVETALFGSVLGEYISTNSQGRNHRNQVPFNSSFMPESVWKLVDVVYRFQYDFCIKSWTECWSWRGCWATEINVIRMIPSLLPLRTAIWRATYDGARELCATEPCTFRTICTLCSCENP